MGNSLIYTAFKSHLVEIIRGIDDDYSWIDYAQCEIRASEGELSIGFYKSNLLWNIESECYYIKLNINRIIELWYDYDPHSKNIIILGLDLCL